jgi:CRP/FNR family cyclic AMP-dependent transcriptional regulator
MSRLVKYFGVTIRRGEFIFREGDPAEVMYMIHKGKVQISKGIGSFDEKIRILGEGEFIGEMAVINSMPRSANAVAMEDCVLIRMDRESFNETIRKNHDFSVSVIQLLSERLRETDELLMIYAGQERQQRLYTEILSDMLELGKRDASGRWFLVRKDDFLSRAYDRMPWNTENIKAVMNELVLSGRVRIKKDRAGTEWIAAETSA